MHTYFNYVPLSLNRIPVEYQQGDHIIDCFLNMFACNKNKALQPARTYRRHGRP